MIHDRGGDNHVKVRGPAVGVIHQACESVYNTVACTNKQTTMQCGVPGYMNSVSRKVRGLSPSTFKFGGA